MAKNAAGALTCSALQTLEFAYNCAMNVRVFFLFFIMTGLCLMAGCSSVPLSAPREPTADAPLRTEASANPAATQLVLYAMGMLGVNYKYGGNTPESGFDCSGFVRHVFKESAGLQLPRSAREISGAGHSIAAVELQPGDLVFFNTLKKSFSHVGIYIGDQKFIHAPRVGKAVEIVRMSETYWTTRFDGARRLAP